MTTDYRTNDLARLLEESDAARRKVEERNVWLERRLAKRAESRPLSTFGWAGVGTMLGGLAGLVLFFLTDNPFFFVGLYVFGLCGAVVLRLLWDAPPTGPNAPSRPIAGGRV